MKRTLNNVEKRLKPYHDLLKKWGYKFEGNNLFSFDPMRRKWELNHYSPRFNSLTAVFDYLIPIISEDEFLDEYLQICRRQ